MLIALALGLSACTSTPSRARIDYVPPSTMPVTTTIQLAERGLAKARVRADKQAVNLLAASDKAKAATDKVIKIEGEAANLPVILELARQTHKDLDDLTALLVGTTTENTGLIEELENTKRQLNTALVVDIPKLKTDVGTQTRLLNEANTNLNAALEQGKIDRANAHRFKAIIIGIATFAALAILFGIFGMKMFMPPILWVTIGAPAAVAAFLFFYLG